MRVRWALATVLILSAACGSSVADAGRTALARCGPRTARTLAADASARIYAVGGAVYGCTRDTRRADLIGHRSRSRPGQDRIGVITLAGVVAAYAESRSGVDTLSTKVVVRRLDTGRTLHDADAVTGSLGPEFFESVVALVVRADGAVAWIAHGGSIVQKEGTTEVNRIDRRGETNLDRTAMGNLSSLKLRGFRLSWRDGKALRTSTLL